MAAKLELHKEDLIAERYSILDEKRGGMGRVFFCKDTESEAQKICVLKTLLDEFIFDIDARKRFENEASVWLGLGDLKYTYVLSLRGVVTHEGLPFLKMDFCKNGSLADRMQQKPFTPLELMIFGTQLLMGMEFIDGYNKLVHRDLKPANILFSNEGDVQVSDFGLMKSVQDSSSQSAIHIENTGLTQYRGFVGTVPYAAPEQLAGVPDLDGRADVWAFGLILYELVALKNPFAATSIDDFAKNILTLEPTPIKSYPTLPNKKLGSIIMKCLEKRREKRYPSFRELVNDWDSIIKFKSSPKHANIFISDERFDLNIPSVEAKWFYYFPDRIKGAKTILNFASQKGLEESNNYRKVGNLEACLTSLDKVLGTPENKECYLSEFLSVYKHTVKKPNELPNAPAYTYNETNLKTIIVPSPLQVRDALLEKMIVLVDIVEERFNGKEYIPLLKNYALRIIEAKIQDADLRFLSGQALTLSGDYEQALALLSQLIEEYPTEVKYEQVMMLCIARMDDQDKTAELCTQIIKKNWEKTDNLSLYSCAQAALMMNDYKNCVFFAEKANIVKPNDISTLQKLCSAYLHLGNIEKAIDFYNQMVKVDFKSKLTINLGKSISTVIKTHEAAKKGDADAQFSLFAMYLRGDAVPKDEEKALAWLTKAAKQNHAQAIDFYNKLVIKS